MSWFASRSGNETAEIDSLIHALENPTNVPTSILGLLEMASEPQNAAYICQNGLGAIFTALIHSKLNDEVVSDIFSLIHNLINDHANAILVIDYDLALPVLIDCVDSSNPKKRLAAIKIITKLSVMEPALIQKNLMNDQDRLVHFLKLIDDDNEIVLTEFLGLIPILIVGNDNFQQLFAFYVLSTLVRLAQEKKTSAMAALRAILAGNVNTQNLFFQSDNLDSFVPLLESEDPETMAMLLDLFSEESASKFRHTLSDSKLFTVICDKAKSGNDQFVRLLGLCVRGNQNLCNVLSDSLVVFVTCYIRSTDELYDLYFMSFFKNYLYKLPENCVNLANAIVSIDDRTDEKLITLASECLMASDECKASFIGSSFVISMIGFFISNMFLEAVIPFLICFCHGSRLACLDVINEASQPVTFMVEMMAKDLDRIVHAELCLLMKILLPYVDEVPMEVSTEKIDEMVRDFLTYISTIEKNSVLVFEQKVIEELLDTKPVEEEPVVVEEQKEEPFEPALLSAPEIETPEIYDTEDLNRIVESYERTFEQMKQEQLEERLRYEERIKELSENVPVYTENANDELVQHLTKQLESMKSANAALSEQFDEYRKSGNQEIRELVEKHHREIELERQESQKEELKLRSRIDDLQTKLDNQGVAHQKEMSELRRQYYTKEGEYQTEINRLKNLLSIKTSEAVTALRNDSKAIRNELEIFKAQERSMFAEHIKELRERKRENDKVMSENSHLKYRISQLTKENSGSLDEIKSLKKQIEEHSRIDAEYTVYQAQLNEAQAKILNLVEENATLKTKDTSEASWESLYERVKSENDGLKNELKAARNEFESVKADLAAKETHLRNAETELAEKRNYMSRKDENREIEQLQEQIRDLKRRNDLLALEKQRIQDNASEELREAQLKHESSVQELKRFNESWEDKENEISNLTRDNNDLAEKNRNVQKQLEMSQDECRRLSNTLSSKDRQIEKLQDELSRTRNLNDQLRSIPPPKSDSTTSEVIPMLTENYNKLQQQLAKSSDQISDLMRENQSAKNEIKMKHEQTSDLARENNNLKDEVRRYAEQTKDLIYENNNMKNEVRRYDEQAKDLTRENNSLKDEIRRYREQIDHLTLDKENLTRKLDSVSDRENTAAKLRHDSIELASKVSQQIENSMSGLQTRVSDLMAQCESLQRLRVEHDSLKQLNSTQLIEFKKTKQDDDKTISDLKSKVETLQQKAKYAPIAKELKKKLEETNRQREDLTSRLQIVEQSNEKLSRANAALTSKIREMADDFADQTSVECPECEVLRVKNKKLQTDFQKLRAQTASLTEQNRGLLGQIAELNKCLTKSTGVESRRLKPIETISFPKDESSAGESNNEKQKRALRIIGKLWTDKAINDDM